MLNTRAHLKGGQRKRGYLHSLATTLSLRAVGPATVLSHKCDILSLLKDDQIVRDNRLPVHCRHLESRRHSTVIPVATQMSLPPVCLPPVSTSLIFGVGALTTFSWLLAWPGLHQVAQEAPPSAAWSVFLWAATSRCAPFIMSCHMLRCLEFHASSQESHELKSLAVPEPRFRRTVWSRKILFLSYEIAVHKCPENSPNPAKRISFTWPRKYSTWPRKYS